MYARQLIPGKTVAAVAAHEIQHIRYANFQQKRLEQYKEVVREASQHGPMGDTNPIMDWTGVLKPPYDTKYPEWAAWAAQKQEWKNAKVPDAFKGDKLLAASDGVTPYSEEWWDNYHKNPSSSTFESAVHETLAEMMAQEYKTGFLPSHYWSGPLPRHNQSPEYPEGFATHEGIEAVEEEGTKAWRKLYATVNAAAK
jgi:hypothetical protein